MVDWGCGNTFKLKSGFAATTQLFETDVFEKRADGWLLVSHTGVDMSPSAH